MSNVCQQIVSKLIRAGSLPRRPAMMMSSPWFNEIGNPYRRKSSTVENSTVVREEEGDLFRAPRSTSLAHCVSSDMKMGAGIAVHFRKKFGQVEYLLSQGKSAGEVAVLKDGPRYIFYLVSKKWFYDKPTNASLRSCLLEMKQLCEELEVKNLAMPRIGCGLDGLKWPLVFEMLNDIFSDCDIDVTIYSIPDNKPKFMTPAFSRSQEKFRSYFDIKKSHSLPVSQMTSKRKIHSDSEEDFETPKKRLRISLSSRPRGLDLADEDSPSSPHVLRTCLKRSAEHSNIGTSSQNNSYPAIINNYLSSSQHGESEFLVYDQNRSKTEIPFLSDHEEGSIKVTSSKSCPSKSNEGSPEHQNARLVNKKLTPSKFCMEIEKSSEKRKLPASIFSFKSNVTHRESADKNRSFLSNMRKKNDSFGDDDNDCGHMSERHVVGSELDGDSDDHPTQRKTKISGGERERTPKKLHKSHEDYQASSDDASDNEEKSPVPSKGKSKERKSRDSRRSKDKKSRDKSKSKERKSRKSSKSKERKSREASKSKERKCRESSKSKERKSRESSKSKERKSRESSKSKERKSRESRRSKEKKSRGCSRNREKGLSDTSGSKERKSHADWSDEETSEMKSREIDVCKRRNVRGSKWNDKHELEDSYEIDKAAENSSSHTKSQKLSREVEDSDDMSDKIDIPRSLLKQGVRVQLNIAENSGTITISKKLSRENENSDDMLDRCDFPTGHRKQTMRERPHIAENLNGGTSSQKFVGNHEDSDDMSDESDFPRRQSKLSVRKRLGGCVSKSSITTEPKSADKLKHQPYPALSIYKNMKRTESPTGTMYCDRKTAATSVKARLSLGDRSH